MAFSLLELLVAIAILALLGVLIMQLVSATTLATRQSNKGIDATAQARLAFDRMGLDLAARVSREDIDFAASSALASQSSAPLQFFSEVTSPRPGLDNTNNRGISLVGYKIATNAETPRRSLLRGGRPLEWRTSGFLGLSTNGMPLPVSDASVALAPNDFDVLAPAVIQAAIGFQLYPDGRPVRLADGTAVAACRGQIVYSPPVRLLSDGSPSAMIDPARISSLVVGLVAMDPRAAAELTDTQIGALAAAFPVPQAGELPMAGWVPIADNATALPADVPLPARQSLRVFQRAFPINPFFPQ